VLGYIFVVNMTGNVVFLAFALAGASGYSILASLVVLCSFVLGSFGGGLLGLRLGQHRGRLLSAAAALQTLSLCAAAVLAALSGKLVKADVSYGLIIMLGIAMGLKSTTARKLAVPDLTTTVLTLTIVGIAADSRLVGGNGSRAGLHLIAMATTLVGALVGSLLILHLSIVSPLVIALIVMAMVAVTARVLSHTDPGWVRASYMLPGSDCGTVVK
jgi:uncharacterized membrane protein YoaK (UPF0700 family)